MSWDQSTSRESVQHFLLRELEIDSNALIRKAIEEAMTARGLKCKLGMEPILEGDMFSEFNPTVIHLSDRSAHGLEQERVFVERLTEVERYDDSGHDHYSFERADLPFVQTTNHHDDRNDSVVQTRLISPEGKILSDSGEDDEDTEPADIRELEAGETVQCGDIEVTIPHSGFYRILASRVEEIARKESLKND